MLTGCTSCNPVCFFCMYFLVYLIVALVTCACSRWTNCPSCDSIQCQRANTDSWTYGEKFLKNYGLFLLESCCSFWVSTMTREEEMWIKFDAFQPLLHSQKQNEQTPSLLCCNKGQTVWPHRSTSVGGIDRQTLNLCNAGIDALKIREVDSGLECKIWIPSNWENLKTMLSPYHKKYCWDAL